MKKLLINFLFISIFGLLSLTYAKSEEFKPNIYFSDPPKFSYDNEFICFDLVNGTVFVGRSDKGWVRRVENIEYVCDYFVYKNQHKTYQSLKDYLIRTQGRNNFNYGKKYAIADSVFHSFLGKKPERKYSKVLHQKIKFKQTQIVSGEKIKIENENQRKENKKLVKKEPIKASSSAKTNLPRCIKKPYHNCIGTWKPLLNNQRYVGEFQNGKKDGKGVYTWPSGERYEGAFKNNQRNGKGIFTYPNGDKYEVYSINDKIHGKAIWTQANGDVYEQNWNMNEKISEIKISKNLNINKKNTKRQAQSIEFNIKQKKEQCTAIGFKAETEKFADCVLRLVELDIKQQQSDKLETAQNSGNEALVKQLQRQQYDRGTDALLNLGQQLLNPQTTNSNIYMPQTQRCTIQGFGTFAKMVCR